MSAIRADHRVAAGGTIGHLRGIEEIASSGFGPLVPQRGVVLVRSAQPDDLMPVPDKQGNDAFSKNPCSTGNEDVHEEEDPGVNNET